MLSPAQCNDGHVELRHLASYRTGDMCEGMKGRHAIDNDGDDERGEVGLECEDIHRCVTLLRGFEGDEKGGE